MSRYISYGIDLGTTNSCIAQFAGDRVIVFQNNDQMNVTPSAVRLEKSGRVIVGRRAYASKMANPTNVASEFKRWMGQKDKHTFQASDRQLSAEELSAEVLKALLEDVRIQNAESVDAAVITVPAAFGQLQCEATARAAKLAGLKESPLLQEPIAAAIAYGITPDAKDQKWLVFDLGGGTFDVAVMSSRDGRLSVLEHRGNNHLGGKDIDRLLVEQLLLPELQKQFALSDKGSDPNAHRSLMQRLHLKAEEAKIDLSRNQKVTISLFDLGTDLDGNEIEGELEVHRSQLEQICEPLISKCIALCEETIAQSRADESSLDRILLVGGPTLMPIIRSSLEDRFKAKLEHSLDPMTVVAQGAAIHAAAIERMEAKTVSAPAASNELPVTLAYEPVSSSLQSPVAGRIDIGDHSNISIRIDAESGHWTSGWITVEDETFEIAASLLEGKTSKFWLYARDVEGRALQTNPDSFSIRHGLKLSAPPLPHTISVEIVTADGTTLLEPMFKRGTSLPNEISKTFRAAKSLRPSEDDSIAIKLWEGEALAEPEANDLVGNLLIDSKKLQRVLPEGSEIEITVTIDSSRLLTVAAFMPRLNAHISDDMYVPQRDKEEYAELVKSIPEQLEVHYSRLDDLENSVDASDKQALESVKRVREQLEELDFDLDSQSEVSTDQDPDRAKRLVEESKNIRASLGNLETKVSSSAKMSGQLAEIDDIRPQTEEIVESYGSPLEKKELGMLQRELERSLERDDDRSLKKAVDGFRQLYWRVLFKQDWFWKEAFKELTVPGKKYTNQSLSSQLLDAGNQAIRDGNGQKIREVVADLWKLLPKNEAELDRERAMRAGIRVQ